MTRAGAVLLLLTSGATLSFGAKKEIVQLQRDMAILQSDVRSLQSSLNQSLGEARALAEQTLDRVNDVHAAGALRNQSVAENWDKLNLTIATLNAKLSQNAADNVATRETIADLNIRLQRLEQKLEDIGNSVLALQNSGGPPAGMPAETLFQSAIRDKMAGQLELALNGFEQYVKHYGSTEMAADAEFYMGEIHYQRGELAEAEAALSGVVDRHPKSGKAADAMLLRALTREKRGEFRAAQADLKKLLSTYRRSNAAKRAETELSRLERSASRACSR